MSMTRKKKKKVGSMLKIIGAIVLVLIIVFLAVAFYTGLLNPVTIKKETEGPYYIACLDNIGPYKGIAGKIASAKKILDSRKIIPIAACGLYFDDPGNVSADKLRSKGGYLVKEGTALEILEKLTIPRREVVVARIKAKPSLAAIKAYPRIHKWIAANKYEITGPALEIYHKDGTIEIQMPIKPSPKPEPQPKIVSEKPEVKQAPAPPQGKQP